MVEKRLGSTAPNTGNERLISVGVEVIGCS